MPHPIRRVALTAAVLALTLFALRADAPAAAAPPATTRVIVALSQPTAGSAPAPRAAIDRAAADVIADLPPSGVTIARQFDAVPGFVANADDATVAALRADPRVAAVTTDFPLHFQLAEAATLIHSDAVRAGIGLDGAGVTVAVIDSGIDTDHPDLVSDIAFQQCFAIGGCPGGGMTASGPGSAEDSDGHGTYVSGIITSDGIVSPPGIAPGAKVGMYRIEGADTTVYLSDIDAAMNDIIANHPEVRVVNLSLGDGVNHGLSCDGLDPVLTSAINTLRASNTLTFVASGNDQFTNGLAFPGCISNAVTIGAVYDDTLPETMNSGGCTETPVQDRVVCFSNSATALDLLAPGAMITTDAIGGGTFRYVGTSFAAPAAAASGALLVQLNPSLTASQIETTLKTTGVNRTDAKSGVVTPRIDLWKAAQSLIADPDGDGLTGPNDNCPTVSNASQPNNDTNFIDQSPPYAPAVDDKTLAKSDLIGDACDPDDDNDGLPDTTETNLVALQSVCPTATAVTNPLGLDSDGDRVVDGSECALGSDPANIASKPANPSPANDPDNDKLSTAFEATIGSDPNDIDTDGDGISDGVEYKGYRTSPTAADSDGDNVRDGCEVASINGDTVVNVGDQATLSAELVRVGAPPKLANMDINKDGAINPGDQALQASKVGSGECP